MAGKTEIEKTDNAQGKDKGWAKGRHSYMKSGRRMRRASVGGLLKGSWDFVDGSTCGGVYGNRYFLRWGTHIGLLKGDPECRGLPEIEDCTP